MTKPQSLWAPDYTRYAVVDLETTVRAPDCYKFKGSPAYGPNKTVAAGLKTPTSERYLHIAECRPGTEPISIATDTLLVGHNVKFDLQYMAKAQGKFHATLIWDTGVAHYMMLGQKDKMPSLNEVAGFYGLGSKEEGISELWEMGVQTEDIEPEKLLSYLKQDVRLTEKVYLAQMERLKELPKLRDHILRVSTASRFLGECELTGLPIQLGRLFAEAAVTKLAYAVARNALYEFAERRYSIPVASRDLWEPTTPKNVGRMLFDLPIEVEDWEPAGRILKSGKVAKRRARTLVEYKPPEDELHKAVAALPVPRTGSGQIQTSDDLLDALAGARSDLVPHIKEYRAKSKLYSTYMEPSKEFVEAASTLGLHPSFHLTTTNTGRTSSSGPNAQQFPPELEACVLPVRGAYLVKGDFKQLQICGVAMLSGDPQLTDDLKNGRDVHYETGKTVFGWTDPSQMDKADRRVVKNTNFGLLFGGKAAGIAKQTGVSKDLVQDCINAFFGRYPKVKEWVDKNIELVERVAVPAEGEFINGEQVREAYLQTPAGRVLRFVEREVPDWVRRKTGRSIGFSPNEVANYPVQAYTDGDLALVYLAILGMQPDRAYTPINFVHDSVWVLTGDIKQTKIQLQQAVDELNDKMSLSVPLKLDFEVVNYEGKKVDDDGNEIRKDCSDPV